MSTDMELPEVDRWVLHRLRNGQCERCGTRYWEPRGLREEVQDVAVGRPAEGGIACVLEFGLVSGARCDPAAPWPPSPLEDAP